MLGYPEAAFQLLNLLIFMFRGCLKKSFCHLRFYSCRCEGVQFIAQFITLCLNLSLSNQIF